MTDSVSQPNYPYSQGIWGKLNAYVLLMRLDRPIGSYLVLWPTLWALWFAAQGFPPWPILLIFVCGVFLMRSAGCAINDFADRNFDGHVERTLNRPLPAGIITPREALLVFVVVSLFSFGLALFLNWQTIALSTVALLLTFIYPFTKRHTHMPQLFLGLAFAWAIPMAFMAVLETIPSYAWLLFIATVVMSLFYDTQYAMVDRKDDLKIGVKSTAILFGRYDKPIIVLLQVIFLLLLIAVGIINDCGAFYYAGLVVAAGLFVHQYRLMCIPDARGCLQAFLNNHYVGMAIFIGLLLDYAYLQQCHCG